MTRSLYGSLVVLFLTLFVLLAGYLIYLQSQLLNTVGASVEIPTVVPAVIVDAAEAESLVEINALSGAVNVVAGGNTAQYLDSRFKAPIAFDRYVTTESTGVVILNADGTKTPAINSNVTESQTPVAASMSGEFIAWVNPMDGSLQVFKFVNETYVPYYLESQSTALSFGFSSDQKFLLTGHVGANGSEVRALNLETKETSVVYKSPDLVILTNENYE